MTPRSDRPPRRRRELGYAAFVSQKILAISSIGVQQLLALRGVLALLRRAGQLGGLPEHVVQVGVLLEVLGLEVVGPEHPQVVLHEVGALLLDQRGAVLEDRVVRALVLLLDHA